MAKASSKRFTYYYPWQTCYMRHLLNSPGSIHPLTCFKASQVISVQLPPLSIARYSFTAEGTRGTIVATRSPHGTVFDQLAG